MLAQVQRRPCAHATSSVRTANKFPSSQKFLRRLRLVDRNYKWTCESAPGGSWAPSPQAAGTSLQPLAQYLSSAPQGRYVRFPLPSQLPRFRAHRQRGGQPHPPPRRGRALESPETHEVNRATLRVLTRFFRDVNTRRDRDRHSGSTALVKFNFPVESFATIE